MDNSCLHYNTGPHSSFNQNLQLYPLSATRFSLADLQDTTLASLLISYRLPTCTLHVLYMYQRRSVSLEPANHARQGANDSALHLGRLGL